ncbi:MAG: sigma-70 family RNA polymerase sigma factor [Flavobacteriales bacterium]|nr:sigma-70 family RNA polymerase sigma factor [Flavobacteriales bacterium]
MTQATDLHEPFKLLIEQHRGIVFKIVNTYCFDPDDRMDLAQEIMVQLWRAFAKYDGHRPFQTWMYRIALNVAISHVRTTMRRGMRPVQLNEDLHDLPDDPGDQLLTEERISALQTFIAAQNELDRALLLLYLDDHSYQQIAEILGISESNVGTKISRLKQRIRATC